MAICLAKTTSPRSSIVGWNPRPCSNRGMRRNHVTGPRVVRSSASATLDAEHGGLVLHKLCRIRATKTACTWRYLPEVCTAPTTAGPRGWRATNGVRVMFLPERYPEFGQCVHKICSMNLGPSGCSCKTTGGYTVPMTGVIRGGTSRVGCPRILVSRC